MPRLTILTSKPALSWTDGRRVGLELFAAFTHYGTDLWRLIAWAGGIIFVFAVVFRLLVIDVRSGDDASVGAGFLTCLYMSLAVFAHLSLPPRVSRLAGASRVAVLCEGLVGWIWWWPS